MSDKKKIPEFSGEKEEAEFWAEHDSTDYIDWTKAKKAKFPNLKPSTKTISLRLTESMLEDVKILAHKNDIPYQSLMKAIIADYVKKEQTDKHN